MKHDSFLKKIIYSIGANIISLVVSVLTSLFIPKLFAADTSQYGYLQIFLFYKTYLGLFHFGWCDGLMLKDAGKHYDELNKNEYSAQFWLLCVMEIIISMLIIIISMLLNIDSNRQFVFIMLALSILFLIPRTMLSYYLQMTSRVKEYSSIVSGERIIYGIEIVILLIIQVNSFKFFVFAELIAYFFALAIGIYWCRDIVFAKPNNLFSAIKPAWNSITIGIKLLLANMAGLLVSGIIRWGIQQKWDVSTYGRISFSMNISNLLLTFISAIAIVLYPALRRVNKTYLHTIYDVCKNTLDILIIVALVFYYPIVIVLSKWLPQYSMEMKYMAILFPMCIFAAKNSLLIQTYMQVYRLERQILFANIIGVIIALVSTIFSVFILHNLTYAMLSIVLTQLTRCVVAEILLKKSINIEIHRDIILEIVMTIIFMIANWRIQGWGGFIVYAIAVLVYLLYFKLNDLKHAIMFYKEKLLLMGGAE